MRLLLHGRRRWLVAATAVAVLGSGTGAWALSRSSPAVAATYTLVAASRGTIKQTVTSTGTLAPARQSDLVFSVSGTVTAVTARMGQKVASGAVLATLSNDALESSVDTASAAVTAAEQQLTSVAASTSTQIAAAKAQLAQAKSTLTQAEADLAAASLRAPFSGVVAAVGLTVGDVVAPTTPNASSATTATSSAITVISTGTWIVNAAVGSADLAMLKKGLQAQITPTGGATVYGTVASVGIVASTSTSGSATFPVVIDVTGRPAGLYAGATAAVSITVKQVQNVLTIPSQALVTSAGATVVHQRKNGQQISTPVTVGTSYGATTEITAGLKAGDEVEVTFGRPAGATRPRTGGTQQNQGPPAGFPVGPVG